MRSRLARLFTSALVLGSLLAGCGDGGTGGEGGGTGGGTTSNTTSETSSGTTTSDTASTSTTDPVDCSGTLNGTSCANCIESSCCAKMAACLADPECKVCFLDPSSDPAVCADSNIAFSMLALCVDDSCQGSCSPFACDAPATAPSGGSCVTLGGAFQCNPVTNAGCNGGAGSACDFDGQGFVCFDPPNDQALCAACGQSDGWCSPGNICLGGTCARYCCDDGDCGTGKCVKGDFSPVVGYCAALPVAIPCDGKPDGVCNPAKETCQCADCTTTAYCVKDKCTTNGACTVDDSCICPDCDDAAGTCGCNYDGTCQSFTEWCQCPDCWNKAECADNPKDKCKDDGACGDTEYCVCVDCQPTGLCQDPNYCTDDGECVAYEGCHCNDCQDEPTCP